MARILIVGCGCRGQELAEALHGDGHAIRATSRRAGRVTELEAAGMDARQGDPDRVATLAPALEHVGVLCILLGSATGTGERVAELHGSRLDMLLLRALDSTVRGIVYEAAGAAGAEVLAGGAARVERFCSTSRIPYSLLHADPVDHAEWLHAARAAVLRLL